MKRLLLGTAAAVALSAGVAADARAQYGHSHVVVDQDFLNVQSMTNTIAVVHNNTDTLQDATNAANIVTNEDVDLKRVEQFGGFFSGQFAYNTATTVYGQWNNLDQDALNVVNSVAIDDTPDIRQRFRGEQSADNYASFGQWANDVVQNATNAANIADVNNVAEVVQRTPFTVEQRADNDLVYTGPTFVHAPGMGEYEARQGEALEVAQSATNVVNSLDVEYDSEEVRQRSGAFQKATNYVSFGSALSGASDGEGGYLGQEATNVANLADIGRIADHGSISQRATLAAEQKFKNIAVAEASGGYLSGQVDDFTQRGANVANMLTTGFAPGNPSVTITQFAALPQTGLNLIEGNGRTGNVQQIGSNLANILTLR